MLVQTLKGKTAIVTGASGGIGSAICRELCRRGASVTLVGRDTNKLLALHSTLSSSTIHTCDLQSPSSIHALITSVPRTDILVNSAGISHDSLAIRQPPNELDLMMQTNLTSVMQLCSFYAKGMVRNKTGCVVNVASVVGMHGNKGQSAYAATKGGVIAYTKALARELGPKGVRANVVAPGFIDTEMTQKVVNGDVTKRVVENIPLQMLGRSEDVAQGVAYLVEASYVTGHVLVIDGGLFT
ncbi:hypothetical protein IWW46_005172 [Coemansia sp. RSA 2440]|nr:hypothetical protein IWW46_005172 [Coemansia sp. RSA 2440]